MTPLVVRNGAVSTPTAKAGRVGMMKGFRQAPQSAPEAKVSLSDLSPQPRSVAAARSTSMANALAMGLLSDLTVDDVLDMEIQCFGFYITIIVQTLLLTFHLKYADQTHGPAR